MRQRIKKRENSRERKKIYGEKGQELDRKQDLKRAREREKDRETDSTKMRKGAIEKQKVREIMM